MVESGAQALIEEITGEFAKLPDVTAVVLSGSNGSEFSDAGSDLDLYVYAGMSRRRHGAPVWRKSSVSAQASAMISGSLATSGSLCRPAMSLTSCIVHRHG